MELWGWNDSNEYPQHMFLWSCEAETILMNNLNLSFYEVVRLKRF